MTMTHVLVIIVFISCLHFSIAQQCTATTFGVTADRSMSLPLTVPACFRCGYIVGLDLIAPTDVTWKKISSGIITPLTSNTSGVQIESSANKLILILNNPGDVVSVGDELRCYSAQARNAGHSTGEHIITIIEFNFLNPLISPNDSTVDITEGSNLTLSCDDPGNTGSTSYQWFNVTGSELSNRETTPPAVLTFNDIQRTSSGVYICRSSKTNIGIKDSNVTINVQFFPDNPVTGLEAISITDESIELHWLHYQYDANPPIIGYNISWRNTKSINESAYSKMTSVSSDVNTAVITGLLSDTVYNFTIFAYNNVGTSKPSYLTYKTDITKDKQFKSTTVKNSDTTVTTVMDSSTSVMDSSTSVMDSSTSVIMSSSTSVMDSSTSVIMSSSTSVMDSSTSVIMSSSTSVMDSSTSVIMSSSTSVMDSSTSVMDSSTSVIMSSFTSVMSSSTSVIMSSSTSVMDSSTSVMDSSTSVIMSSSTSVIMSSSTFVIMSSSTSVMGSSTTVTTVTNSATTVTYLIPAISVLIILVASICFITGIVIYCRLKNKKTIPYSHANQVELDTY